MDDYEKLEGKPCIGKYNFGAGRGSDTLNGIIHKRKFYEIVISPRSPNKIGLIQRNIYDFEEIIEIENPSDLEKKLAKALIKNKTKIKTSLQVKVMG